MKSMLALVAAATLTMSAPAFAQSAGATGAAPAGGGAGANTPGSGGDSVRNGPAMNNGMSEGRASATDRNNPTNVAPDPRTNTKSQSNGS
jgi:opacity protein-like surface antigen